MLIAGIRNANAEQFRQTPHSIHSWQVTTAALDLVRLVTKQTTNYEGQMHFVVEAHANVPCSAPIWEAAEQTLSCHSETLCLSWVLLDFWLSMRPQLEGARSGQIRSQNRWFQHGSCKLLPSVATHGPMLRTNVPQSRWTGDPLTKKNHRNAIHTLKKNLSLDYSSKLPSTVTNSNRRKMPSTSYAQLKNKISYSPPSHKMQPTIWDPLTTNTTLCGTTLNKYKHNHTTSFPPQKTRSNASPGKRIWTKGPATLNHLNWHCFRFALGHHLFQHPLSPYDEKSAQDVAKLLPRMKEQASTATTTTHSLFLTPFHLRRCKAIVNKFKRSPTV